MKVNYRVGMAGGLLFFGLGVCLMKMAGLSEAPEAPKDAFRKGLTNKVKVIAPKLPSSAKSTSGTT